MRLLNNECLDTSGSGLSGKMHIDIFNDMDVVSVRQQIRQVCRAMGFRDAETLSVVIAASEIARNIVVYANQGEMTISEISSCGNVGLLIVAKDCGPGIEHLELAMEDGYSTGNTLGFGLPGAKRLMDQFTIKSKPGEGTEVRMIKWKE